MRLTKRVVVTGGPAAGKTSVIHLLNKGFTGFEDRIVIVPESATILYSGGFVRSSQPEVIKSAQRAILQIQQSLEASYEILYPDKLLVCDRGTLDGAAYWPDGPDDFFAHFKTSRQMEYKRYDAVLFFETSAVGEFAGTTGNSTRNEDKEEAIAVDRKLQAIYRDHPNVHFIPHFEKFGEKLEFARKMLATVIENETYCSLSVGG